MGTQAKQQSLNDVKSGGARRDRTADLLHAMQALSQLSYGPTWRRGTLPEAPHFVKKMNGLRVPGGHGPPQACEGLFFAQYRERGVDGWRDRPATHSKAHRLRYLSQ